MRGGKISTGCEGLDILLRGGFPAGGICLVEGLPGTGKTTLGLGFLRQGVTQGEDVLFISLEEPQQQIKKFFPDLFLDKIRFLDVSPSSSFFTENRIYDVFTPADVERDPLTRRIYQEIEAVKPTRILIDSATQFRFLANNPYQFLRYMISFFSFLREQGITTLFTSEPDEAHQDVVDIRYNVDCALRLTRTSEEMTLEVLKDRSSNFRAGRFDYRITEKGIVVSVLPEINEVKKLSFVKEAVTDTFSSGVPHIDELLGGGFPFASVTLITGPSGVGKTTFLMQFLKQLALLNHRILYYSFDERKESIIARCESVNIPITSLLDQKKLVLYEFFGESQSSYELIGQTLEFLTQHRMDVLVLDSVNTFVEYYGKEKTIRPLLLFCKLLLKMGVTVFLIHEDSKVISTEFQATQYNLSNITDNILFLRYIEVAGTIRRAIGVLKKRLGGFEKTMREFEITPYGIKVGEPLTSLSGILTGNPILRKEGEKG
ncbi:MAG: AAA family ATPase [Brevinematales bacterium]|nr:AAA family ATPase [Brevinematales bacterium]